MDVNEAPWVDQAMALLDELQKESPRGCLAAEMLLVEIAIAEHGMRYCCYCGGCLVEDGED
jgi:hypothetical protein